MKHTYMHNECSTTGLMIDHCGMLDVTPPTELYEAISLFRGHS